MRNIILIFIILQTILLFFMALHDWIHLPPLTDIRELEKHHSKKQRLIASSIYAILVLIPLSLTLFYKDNLSSWILINIVIFYLLLSIGVILSWWVPYFFGSSEEHKKAFAEYRNTHHFLPARGDNIIPNTLHVIFHLQIWACFVISLYLLIKKD